MVKSSFLTGMLQVQKKVPADGLRPQRNSHLFMLHGGKTGKLGLKDEELGPGEEAVGASEKA